MILSQRILLTLVLSITLKVEHLSAGEITMVRSFETWNAGIIKSADPVGITYHAPSGHLFIADSEIDEIDAIWSCENIFEISLSGNQVFHTFDSYVNKGSACTGVSANDSRDREPTGITYNEFDGYFYITNDDRTRIMRYSGHFGEADCAKFVQGADLEGITSDPSTGYLYVVVGAEGIHLDGISRVLVYNPNLDSLSGFSVNDRVVDPEGITYNQQLNHLFLVSHSSLKIFEYTLNGEYVTDYDISSLDPTPSDPLGLTFAPSSDTNDDPDNFNLYIVDRQIDNDPIPENDRDGLIYETRIGEVGTGTDSIPSGFRLSQNYPNPFNPETEIRFQSPKTTQVVMKIYNVNGQEIRSLLDKRLFAAGTYAVRWDGKDDHGHPVSSGVYFYQLKADEFSEVKKMSLLR